MVSFFAYIMVFQQRCSVGSIMYDFDINDKFDELDLEVRISLSVSYR